MHTSGLRNYSFHTKKIRIKVAFHSGIDIQLHNTKLTLDFQTPILGVSPYICHCHWIIWDDVRVHGPSLSHSSMIGKSGMWLGSVLKLTFSSTSHKYQPHAYRARHQTAFSSSLLLCSSFPHASHRSRQDIKSFETLNLLTTETGFQ